MKQTMSNDFYQDKHGLDRRARQTERGGGSEPLSGGLYSQVVST